MSHVETVPDNLAATLVKPAILSRAAQAEVVYRQRFVPHSANLSTGASPWAMRCCCSSSST